MAAAPGALLLLLTTVVGSYLRPAWWHLAAEAIAEGPFGSQDEEETPDFVAERIRMARKYVPAEQLRIR